MAEPDQVPDNEVARLQEDREEGEREEHALSESAELQNAQSAAELNLIIVFLALRSSQHSEEGLTLAKNEEEEEEERHKAKASMKKVQKSRREIDEVKPVRRRTTERFKTTVRDSRHGRRL